MSEQLVKSKWKHKCKWINLDSLLKSRDIVLPTNVCLVKAMVFPAVMYGLRVVLSIKLSAKELMVLNSGVGEDS